MTRQTILLHASDFLRIAEEISRWPPGHCFSNEEVQIVVNRCADRSVRRVHIQNIKWSRKRLQCAARTFLRDLGRLCLSTPSPVKDADKLEDFITALSEDRWLSAETRRGGKWQVVRFLDYLDQRCIALDSLKPEDIDAYIEHVSSRWCRRSIRMATSILRAWLKHCEARGWVRKGLAATIMSPRIYQMEGLPLGPTWEEVGRMLDKSTGDDPTRIRNHAILLLLSVYGLRSGEVRHLLLDDIDWEQERLRVVRSKNYREDILPLEPTVGNALVRYLRHVRPQSDSRTVFLTLHAPHRPLSSTGLYHVVEQYLTDIPSSRIGRGPHGLRHACARHLTEAGRSFKEVGDHLGHRSSAATRIYSKVDLVSLRRVAFTDLRGLS